MRGFAAGEVQASEDLYDRYASRIYGLGLVMLGNEAAAEDLVQDAFVKLAGRLVHLRDRNAFPAYLRSMVVNLARMQFRRGRRERASLARQAGMRLPEPVERDFAETEMLRTQLLRLTERQRAAVVLRFYEDLSDSQTARILGCAPGTVRSLVSRAMETLRQEVEQ